MLFEVWPLGDFTRMGAGRLHRRAVVVRLTDGLILPGLAGETVSLVTLGNNVRIHGAPRVPPPPRPEIPGGAPDSVVFEVRDAERVRAFLLATVHVPMSLPTVLQSRVLGEVSCVALEVDPNELPRLATLL
ncbi:MAG: hypothetical protein KC656_13380, partial [Myxococcales bacterium]|nr:hypothetical protein [Myxococcales bacterium]